MADRKARIFRDWRRDFLTDREEEDSSKPQPQEDLSGEENNPNGRSEIPPQFLEILSDRTEQKGESQSEEHRSQEKSEGETQPQEFDKEDKNPQGNREDNREGEDSKRLFEEVLASFYPSQESERDNDNEITADGKGEKETEKESKIEEDTGREDTAGERKEEETNSQQSRNEDDGKQQSPEEFPQQPIGETSQPERSETTNPLEELGGENVQEFEEGQDNGEDNSGFRKRFEEESETPNGSTEETDKSDTQNFENERGEANGNKGEGNPIEEEDERLEGDNWENDGGESGESEEEDGEDWEDEDGYYDYDEEDFDDDDFDDDFDDEEDFEGIYLESGTPEEFLKNLKLLLKHIHNLKKLRENFCCPQEMMQFLPKKNKRKLLR